MEKEMTPEEFKAITSELCYIRRALETLVEQKPVEVHYHYTVDYGKIIETLQDAGYLK